MVLLFLRDLRAVIIVVLNIPLALLGSIVILNLTGNTINIMTLGGLALAIGILVDEATVEIENIHTQMEHTPSMSRAVRQGNMETAVPRLLALLCILSVFIPSFIMVGAVRALFVPLSLAVGGAMITSYLLSSTFVPVLSVWLLENRHGTHGDGAAEARPGFFLRMQDRFERIVDWTVAHRRKVVLAYLLATGTIVVLVGGQLGRELFPRVDTGQLQLRVRPPQGTQYELTTRVAQKTLDVIAEEVGPDKVDITMGYAGGNPPQFTINMAYLWSRGPDDSLLRVGLREGSGIDIFELQERLRKVLPEKVGGVVPPGALELGRRTRPGRPPRCRHDLRVRAGRPDLSDDEPRCPRADRSGRHAVVTWPTPVPTWISSASSSTRSRRSATRKSSSPCTTPPSRSPSTASGPA